MHLDRVHYFFSPPSHTSCLLGKHTKLLYQEITKLLPQANDRTPGEISGLFAFRAIILPTL